MFDPPAYPFPVLPGLRVLSLHCTIRPFAVSIVRYCTHAGGTHLNLTPARIVTLTLLGWGGTPTDNDRASVNKFGQRFLLHRPADGTTSSPGSRQRGERGRNPLDEKGSTIFGHRGNSDFGRRRCVIGRPF